MEGDIEMMENDMTDTDFSQTKIIVHDKDVAEKLIEKIADIGEEENEIKYNFSLTVDDVKQLLQNHPKEYEDVTNNGIPMSEDQLDKIPKTEDKNNLDIDMPTKSIDHLTYEYSDDSDIKEEVEELLYGTDLDLDETCLDICNDDLPPEDKYHFYSKIILGLKPQNTPETNFQITTVHNSDYTSDDDATQISTGDNLKAVVLLEDCSAKLEQNPSFCKDCGILFSNNMNLNTHIKSCHSSLVAVDSNVVVQSTDNENCAEESTGATDKRQILKRTCKNVSYRTKKRAKAGTGAINKHKSLEMICKKVRNRTKKRDEECMGAIDEHKILERKCKVIVTSDWVCNYCNITFPDQPTWTKHLREHSFKCNFCNSYFNQPNELFEHTEIAKHIKLEVQGLVNQNIDQIASNSLIPMSVLFQCPICETYFLTAFSGMQHWITCCEGTWEMIEILKCKTCKCTFCYQDLPAHKEQHKVCKQFRVYEINHELYERTLCTCLKCGIHFNEASLRLHLNSCGKIKTDKCKECKLHLPESILGWHLKTHTQHNLKSSDFIKVQYYGKYNTNPPLTVASAETSNQGTIEEVVQEIEKPSESQTDTLVDKVSVIDEELWLNFCPTCKTCCIRSYYLNMHLSKQCKFIEKITCLDCGLQFSQIATRAHRNMHKMKSFTVRDIIFFEIGTKTQIIPPVPDYPECENCKVKYFNSSDLSKHCCGEDYQTCNICHDKYHNSIYDIHIQFHEINIKILDDPEKKESLLVLPHIVFSCTECKIVTDSYNFVIEHSQGHLKIPGTIISRKYIECNICHLKFERMSWPKHSRLHLFFKIDRKYYKILVYNPKKLLSEKWFQLFDGVPKDEIRRITEDSFYGHQRQVNVKLLRNGCPEYTLYCCNVCKVCFHPHEEIAMHMTKHCKTTHNDCEICEVSFRDAYKLSTHKRIHMQKGWTNTAFRIVTFIKTKEMIKKLNILKPKPHTPTILIYKCKVCRMAMIYKLQTRLHICHEHQLIRCPKCKLKVLKSVWNNHKREHIMHPDYFDKIKIELFDPANDMDDISIEDCL